MISTTEIKEKGDNWSSHSTNSSIKKITVSLFCPFFSVLHLRLYFPKNRSSTFWCHKEMTPGQWRSDGSYSYFSFIWNLKKKKKKKGHSWYANPKSGCPFPNVNGRMLPRNCVTLYALRNSFTLSCSQQIYSEAGTWGKLLLYLLSMFWKDFMCVIKWIVWLFQEELRWSFFYLLFLLFSPFFFFFISPQQGFISSI